MSGSRKWIDKTVEGRLCPRCFARFTKYATRGISVKLLPRPDGKGFGALFPVVHVPCPTCKTVHEIPVSDVTRADIKKGLDWLHERTLQPDNPFAGTWGPDLVDGEHGDPDLFTPDDEQESDDNSPGGTATQPPPPGSTPGTPGRAPGNSPPAGPPAPTDLPGAGGERPNAGRRLASPSVRKCCPPQPITDQTLKAAIRKLRNYSFRRDAPSFRRLMNRFGVKLDDGDGPSSKSP